MKVYILIQSDVWKTKASYKILGIFSDENSAIDFAKNNNYYSNNYEIFTESYIIDFPS